MTRAATQTMPIETEIHSFIESLLEALRERDGPRILAHYDRDLVNYSLAPPLVTSNDPKVLEEWLATWEGPMRYAFRDLKIEAAGDVAFCHGLMTMGGTKIGQGSFDFWFRRTLGLRRRADGWRITHDHESVPFAMDGSFLALTGLEPES